MRVAWAACALLLAGCAGQPDGTSGIQGKAMLGPTCPVERDPPDPQCADRAYAGNLTVLEAGSGRVVKVFTAQDGTFRVALAPGNYTIGDAGSESRLPRCATDGPFAVVAERYTEVTVRCDTGIR
ncbi:MAG: hypothetical protein LC624_00805 [Halobacteriales archaeon]|nr:hypothetical protein [Halobacteriales archaeon]